jgi:putative oxidoreductase
MPTDLPSTILFIGRILIGGVYLYAAIGNIRAFSDALGFMTKRGVPQPREVLIAGIAVHLVSSVLVILGLWTALGALGLVVFTVLATWMYHNFWDYSGPDRAAKLRSFTNNLIAIGGLLVLLGASL